MGLLVDSGVKVFDAGAIRRGCLVCVRHQSWQERKAGFVSAVTEKEIIVQYHPGIANVTNHFFIPAAEVAAGQWELRWSDDLVEIHRYPEESVKDRTGGGDEA